MNIIFVYIMKFPIIKNNNKDINDVQTSKCHFDYN